MWLKIKDQDRMFDISGGEIILTRKEKDEYDLHCHLPGKRIIPLVSNGCLADAVYARGAIERGIADGKRLVEI